MTHTIYYHDRSGCWSVGIGVTECLDCVLFWRVHIAFETCSDIILRWVQFFQLTERNRQYQNINIKYPAHPLCNNSTVSYAVPDLMYEKIRVKVIWNVSLYYKVRAHQNHNQFTTKQLVQTKRHADIYYSLHWNISKKHKTRVICMTPLEMLSQETLTGTYRSL
jgi:hypothetical protein